MSNYLFNHYEEVIELALSSNTDIYTVCESITDCRNTINELYTFTVENVQQEIEDGIFSDNQELVDKIQRLIKPLPHVKDPKTHMLF